ncbi:MAG: uncharacterized protein JWP16_1048, partial [Alphaproteobacteria bacterium]|nr:uncharacterized protein [Alphaproteobacteria bacterium]
MRAALILLCLLPAFPAFAGGEAPTLVGVARVPADAVDSQGETLGGFGSGMMLVPGSWKPVGSGFKARVAMLPDRGWNTAGTTDYRARLQTFDVALAPDDGNPGHEGQLKLTYKGALLLTDNKGVATTGLDPVAVRPAQAGLPDLPVAANGHVSLDNESVAPAGKGGFWIGEEYGPYVYRYDAGGRMTGAIRPPDAFIPMRAGKENFSSNNPPRGTQYDSGDPDTGRQNNQGFEGMSVSPDGRTLFVVNQSALRQDLDPADAKASSRNVRLLVNDIAGAPRLVQEYSVQLP